MNPIPGVAMPMLRRLIVATAVLLLAAPQRASAQAPAERAAVERAGLDYLEGFYEGDTAKLVRALRPDLDKRGFERNRDTGAYTDDRMTYAQAIAYAKSVKARNRPPNPAWPKKVEVLDVLDQTAVAKVTAWWGTDYVLLAKFDGRWMITQVLWQTPVPAPR